MEEFYIEVGEDGGGDGWPASKFASLDEFLASRLSDPSAYWGHGMGPSTVKHGPQGLTGWSDVDIVDARWRDEEPAVWALIRVPIGTNVIDTEGPTPGNARTFNPYVQLHR